MTFNEEVYSQMIGEESISSLVDGIYYGILPDNYKNTKEAIVYESNIFEAFNTISLENYGDNYTLTVKIVSSDPKKIYAIGQAVKDHFKPYSSTNIRSIRFNRDNYVYSDNDDIHVLNLDFIVDYCNT